MKRFTILVFVTILAVIQTVAQHTATSTVPSTKAFGLQPDQIGNASNTVNLLTGDVALPLNLMTLPGRNGLDVNVSINYGSNVSHIVNTWNREAPAGILGLGWSMDIPKIICNNRMTGTREDDEYYLIENGVNNRLVRTKSGSDAGGGYYEYGVKNYQFWKIKYYYDPAEISGGGSGANKWEIIKEDGSKYVYGDKNSGRKTIQYVVRWDNWIGNSAQISGQSQLAIVWNLSEVVGIWGDKILFEYDPVEQFVGTGGLKQTEASYLKQITDVVGRKVQFFYNTKQTQFFVEPHTESAEPDAYQEFYETKYLDHIDALDETGSKFSSVHFSYTTLNDATPFAKMLLASIEQRNASAAALPQMKFDYIASGFAKGQLQSVTYPTGGKVTYEYAQKTIGHSTRDMEINAPSGFSEPMVWTGEDYVVVAWRKMGTGWTHDSGPQDVQLYVYQWVGEWKETYLGTMSGVTLPNEQVNYPIYMYYGDFQIVLEEKFFGVLSKISGNSHAIKIFHKDESKRGGWSTLYQIVDVGDGTPKLLSGYNFVTVAPFRDDTTHPCQIFTYNGNGFTQSTINQTIGDHYYTASNNFFVSQNRAGFDGVPDFSFSYLTEDKKWVSKNWGSWLEYSSDQPSNWYSSDGLAMVMADDNPEYVYRWDISYTNFFRDTKDVSNNDIFGSLADNTPVSIINNNFIAAKGRLARFDGKYWYTASITSTTNSPFGFYYSYGEDIAVRPTELVNGTVGYKGGRKVFDPNALQWLADFDITSAQFQDDVAYVGNDYYYFGNSFYYRQPNGQWTLNTTLNWDFWPQGGYPRFEVWPEISTYMDVRLTRFKNGVLSQNLISGYSTFAKAVLLKAKGEGNGAFILYTNPPGSYSIDPRTFAVKLKLFKLVNDAYTGTQKDQVVSLVTVASYDNTIYTSFDYDLGKSVIDPSGNVAMYNEVTVIPGSSSPFSRPNGYTKTFFYNGLTAEELYTPGLPTDLRLIGAPYETQVYNSAGTLVSSSKTSYTTFTKDLLNVDNVRVDVGIYARPTSIIQTVDGITTTTGNSYSVDTGLLTQSSISGAVSGSTIYKYFWEAYDATRSRNILTPVILTKKILNGQNVEASAVRYKNWTSTNNPSGVFAPFDQYTWKATGSPDFSVWDINSTPSLDWIYQGKVSVRETVAGNALEEQGPGGTTSAQILNANLTAVSAKVSNALESDVAYSSFEDGAKGKFDYSPAQVTASSGFSKTGIKYYDLDATGITKGGLNSSESYKVSFWAKTSNGSVIVDGIGTINLGNLAEWTYIERTVTGRTSINIRKSGSTTVSVDEVRIYPTKSTMVSSTSHPIYGPQFTCDQNNQVFYKEFDEWGRTKNTLNEKGHIITTNFYNYKN